MKMLNYLKNARIERIEYLLRPERMRHKGCLYLIVKFFIFMVAVGLGAFPLHLQKPLEAIAPHEIHIPLAIIIALSSVLFMVALLLICLNELDSIWRRKEDKGYDGHELKLEKILLEYLETESLNPYNQQVIERLIKKHTDLNDHIEDMSGKERALVEDAILYRYEINEIMHPLAYGVKLIFLTTMFVTCATFASLYAPIEDIWRAQYPYDSGLGLIYIIFPVGTFCVWRAYVRAKDIWKAIGPHGRNTARNLLFYWPITLLFLIMINTWIYTA